MLHRVVHVTCNFCRGRSEAIEINYLPASAIRTVLRSAGWMTKGPRDVCPSCAAKGVRP